ncbi:MAG: hypothetical protein WC716_04715 [Chitinophagaceae bacterium]|jgi:hypothetical protein
MTIEELKSKMHEHIENGDNRLIRMLYALVHVYESDVQDEKPTLHTYEMSSAVEPTNNDV